MYCFDVSLSELHIDTLRHTYGLSFNFSEKHFVTNPELSRLDVANAGDVYHEHGGVVCQKGRRSSKGSGQSPIPQMVSTNINVPDGISRHMSAQRIHVLSWPM